MRKEEEEESCSWNISNRAIARIFCPRYFSYASFNLSAMILFYFILFYFCKPSTHRILIFFHLPPNFLEPNFVRDLVPPNHIARTNVLAIRFLEWSKNFPQNCTCYTVSRRLQKFFPKILPGIIVLATRFLDWK